MILRCVIDSAYLHDRALSEDVCTNSTSIYHLYHYNLDSLFASFSLKCHRLPIVITFVCECGLLIYKTGMLGRACT